MRVAAGPTARRLRLISIVLDYTINPPSQTSALAGPPSAHLPARK